MLEIEYGKSREKLCENLKTYLTKIRSLKYLCQACNARKVISEVYASFVLSLSSNVNTRRMSKPEIGSIFHIKKSMKYSDHRKLLCELSKFNAFNYLRY